MSVHFAGKGFEHITCQLKVDGSDSEGDFSRSGTGFYFSNEEDGRFRVFVITNSHLVKDASKVQFLIPIQDKNTKAINHLNATIEDGAFHPVYDLAIYNISGILQQWIPFQDAKDLLMTTFQKANIPTKEDIDNFLAFEDVFIIGYPSGLKDQFNKIPFFRKGITATPYYLNYNGQPGFVIDSTSVPGSSGSPVVIYNQGRVTTKKGTDFGSSRLLLLGILTTSFRENAPHLILDDADFRQFIDLGFCYKSELILEMVTLYEEKFPLRSNAD